MAANEHPSPFGPVQAELAKMRRSNLGAAISDVDQIIALLEQTKDMVETGTDPGYALVRDSADTSPENADAHSVSMSLTQLQNPIKKHCDNLTTSLKDVTKAQRGFTKALDKALPLRELPMEIDTMDQHTDHVNRAILMHLLREGQFAVADQFLQETSSLATGEAQREAVIPDDLASSFARMYKILSELKQSNLDPAILWANQHSAELERKGSSLEFDLTKLQFVWLSQTRGMDTAMGYARLHFHRFQTTHIAEISKLCCATAFAPNLPASPYRDIFDTKAAFDDVSLSFTRDFCSLLGFSAESPLYVAVTAGSIALPRLIKYMAYMRDKKTEWTTDQELGFETPLPRTMVYHPIFVCPVSKEQTTDRNPPMRLHCGHVISKDSLHNMAKGTRYKCPYCPEEGQVSDAVKITF